MKHASREQAALVGSLIDAAPIGIYVLDARMRVLHANAEARTAFGRFADDMVGRELQPMLADLWGAEAAAMSVDVFRHTLRTGEPFANEEFIGQRLDTGEVAYYEWRVVRIALSDGAQGVACFFRDISAKVAARKSIEDSRDALRLADTRKDEFLATLAHELRNPLAPLSNCLHILRLRDTDDAEGKRLRGIMERQLATLVRMTDDLLEVSRITRGKIELRRVPGDLRDIIHAAIETSRPLIFRAQHALDVRMDPLEPLPVLADGVRLSQVFANLLNNAAKYTPPGGRITIELVREEDHARVSVRDTGIGLAPDMLDRVFDLFFQDASGRRLSQGGLGIGLTLVRSLVAMHDGTVAAMSEGPGRGTEFVVLLPLLPGETPHMAPVLATFDGDPLDIIVTDDNRENADSLAQMLRMAGHRVRVAYGGEACLALMDEERPDLVLLDLAMPGLDGFETCRAIRERHGRDLRVLAVTGFGQARDVAESAKAGFDGHIVKPVDPAKLAEGMAGVVRRKPA
jgi:PAS domain S-box-containing protein